MKECYLEEGQFVNDKLHGFGRKIFGDAVQVIGWFKETKVHGFAEAMNENEENCKGIFLNNTC